MRWLFCNLSSRQLAESAYVPTASHICTLGSFFRLEKWNVKTVLHASVFSLRMELS